MAFESGTATDFRNMLSKIATFSAANGWTVLEQSALALYLKGSGSAGLDEIYVGINATEDSDNNRYNFELFGSFGHKAGRAFKDMPMSNGGGVFTYLWNSSMPYWLSVNGRRILCVIKVGSVYQYLHLGFINSTGTDMQYPYPLLIGGCGGLNTYNYATTTDVTAFWAYLGTNASGCGSLCLPGGLWAPITDALSTVAKQSVTSYSPVHYKRESILSCPDGSYLLMPYCFANAAKYETYGSPDGLLYISGYNNTAENTLTIDGVQYMVFPNIYRATNGSFCAMRMN